MIKRSALLTIAGLSTRFYFGDAPPVTAIPGGVGIGNYTDVAALTEVGDWSEGLTLTGGVGEYSGVEVSLATAGVRATATDPGWVLCSMGWQGADAWALLAASVSAAATTITLDRSMGLAAGDLFHLGRETLRVGAVAGGGLTLTGCTRGVGRTVAVPHLVSAQGGPYVTTPLVYLRGREAWLSLSDGSGYREVMAGRIGSSPEVDGVTVRLSITPWPALLSGPLGAATPQAGLVQGWHAFEAGRACVVEHAQVFVSAAVGYSTAYAAGVLSLGGSDAWAHESHFDPGLPDGHPRRGLLRRQLLSTTDLPTAYPSSNQLAVGGTVGWTAGGGDRVEQVGAAELFRVDVTSGAAVDSIQPWPQCLLTPWAARCQTGDHTSDPGGWVDVALFPALGRMGLRRTALNSRALTGGEYDVRVLATYSPVGGWSEEAGVPCADWASGEPETGSGKERLWCALDLRPPGSTEAWTVYSVPMSDTGATRDIGGVALAWYQRGEKYLLIEPAPDGSPPVVMPSTGNAYVILSGVESRPNSAAGRGADSGAWLLEVSAVDAVALGVGGLTAYRLTITPRSRAAVDTGGQIAGPWSVVDWPGGARASVQQVVGIDGERWPEIVAGVLTSPGPSTRYPVGLGLPAGAVAVAGAQDGSLPLVRAVVGADEDVSDQVKGWLQATSQALVVDRRGATVRLLLRDVGLERPVALADATLAHGDCVADSVPASTSDDRVITATELQVDWTLSGESERSVRINDQGAGGVAGESATLTIPLRGVVLDDDLDAVPLALAIGARVSAVSGYPRRLWRVEVPMSWAARVSLGDTVAVDHPLLRGYGPVVGVTGVTARVVELRYSPMRATATVGLAYHGHVGAGWAPALKVLGIVSPTKVTVDLAEYSTADLAWWAAGDGVRCVPIGATDAAVVTSVVGIVGAVVETAAPHGLGIGDRLEPSTVRGVNMGGLAFLGDGSAFS